MKIFDIYLWHYFVTNKKIAITHLWHAIEPQTICHLIVKDKVAEQHILGKYSNCNSFGVTMDLLNSQNFKIAITLLFDIYLCPYFATYKKIAITHLWHAMGPQTMYHVLGQSS